MTLNELNARYGAPGRIIFREGHCGYPNVVLANKYGTAEIALCGANVLSYRPTGHAETIFRPAKRDYNRGDKFHGGVPVCWPQFGNRFSKDLPQHGFAAKMVFDVRGTTYSEDMTEIVLGLVSTPETKAVWPHDFDLEYRITLSMKLNLRLVTKNTGAEPLALSCGFHPYFLVRERDSVTVRGLDGARYVDGTTPDLKEGVWTGDIKMDFAPDHIFTPPAAVKHECAILDAGLRRAIAVVATGNDCIVVWNCGTDLPYDMAEGDGAKYVCVEPVSDWPGGRTLAPGEKYELMAAFQAHLEGAS